MTCEGFGTGDEAALPGAECAGMRMGPAAGDCDEQAVAAATAATTAAMPAMPVRNGERKALPRELCATVPGYYREPSAVERETHSDANARTDS